MVKFGTKEYPLILASGSPRRKEICEQIGWVIDIHPAKTEEPWDFNVSEKDAVLKIARGKAREIFAQYPQRVVLGSDTVVVAPVGDSWKVLGKPKDVSDAKEMLSLLSGKTHRVLTAVWMCSPEKEDGFVSENFVTFKSMTDSQIEAYIATGEPMDKAGAYGIQGEGFQYIEKLDGDFFAVMGLPKEELLQFVQEMF